MTSIRSSASRVILPAPTVVAASPMNPSMVAPTSIFTKSPSWMTRLPGMPWTISSFTEVQMQPGKPRYPLKVGTAPCLRISRLATASKS